MLDSLKLHHSGVITTDPAAATEFYKNIGYSVAVAGPDESQKVEIVLLERDNNTPYIELITPIGERSPAHNWIKRISAGVYHIGFECSDLEATGKDLSKIGCRPVSLVTYSPIFSGPIQFFWSPASGLIEIVQLERLR